MRSGAIRLPLARKLTSLRIRKFEWTDLEVLTCLFNEIGGASGTPRAFDTEAMQGMLMVPGCDPERHCFIAEDGAGNAVGYSLLSYEPPISRAVASGGVLERHRGKGIGRGLMRRVVEHAEELRVSSLHVEAGVTHSDTQHLLSRHGMRVVGSLWKMRWEGEEVPEVRLPSGFSIRSLVVGQDEQTLTELQNVAFEENWGFSPNTVEQIEVRVENNRGGPESIILITEDGIAEGGKPAAYNWTMFYADDDAPSGVIAMTGVHPDYRGRGIGRAVVTVGIANLVERGASVVDLEVDADNTPARELYLNLGFRKVGRSVWYEKRFD